MNSKKPLEFINVHFFNEIKGVMFASYDDSTFVSNHTSYDILS